MEDMNGMKIWSNLTEKKIIPKNFTKKFLEKKNFFQIFRLKKKRKIMINEIIKLYWKNRFKMIKLYWKKKFQKISQKKFWKKKFLPNFLIEKETEDMIW